MIQQETKPIQHKLMLWLAESQSTFNASWQQNRALALKEFQQIGFPHEKMEKWRNTDLSEALQFDYNLWTKEFSPEHIQNDIFQCDVANLDTFTVNLYRGRYVYKDHPIFKMENGVIVGSMAAAINEYPELVEKHFDKYTQDRNKAFDLLNKALFLDGLFVYVPKNIKVEKPIQLINAVGREDNAFVQNRNLIILEEGSELTLIHCDDSYDYKRSFTNSLSEFYIGANAKLDHYKLQNINNNSYLINSDYFHQERNAQLHTNKMILNGGLIRNEVYNKLNGEGAESNILGLYLADEKQHIDNQVFVEHAVSNCQSRELFKGIMDDYAHGVFNGHIWVKPQAQKTIAYQDNNNILLTDKAKINTKPFLEIYADDVKCSHGATIGQLDESSLFYIRQRGIGLENARMLLMYAFAAEVTKEIKIESLQIRIDDMVKRRLRGELSICDQCVLQCSNPELNFEIDLSKIQ
ncbi:MAG: Fe-S cluster assembly protein SufD [Bacteroidetes bacterium 4572_77]|nr:MAG: Fe-S cluster assembly protein SufD [Bacteroidetes bacterium 4572_77]